MLIPGLVSVTFRALDRATIASLMRKSELKAIEWGGDIHIPVKEAPSESDTVILNDSIVDALRLSADSSFYIASFGSYFRCEKDDNINSAVAVSLKAPNIRVWAGTRASADADEQYRKTVVQSIQRLCDKMKVYDITVSTEFHGGTLTDSTDSALRLINDVERENFRTYWQPNQFKDDVYNIHALKSVLPYLSNVHVFTWDSSHRYPLVYGESIWKKYIDIISECASDCHLLLEFVKDDSIEQFYRDAETLKKWIE